MFFFSSDDTITEVYINYSFTTDFGQHNSLQIDQFTYQTPIENTLHTL